MNGAVSTLKKIECYDDARPGFPGEHWIVLGAGVGLRLATGRHRSAMVKTLGNVGATALAARLLPTSGASS